MILVYFPSGECVDDVINNRKKISVYFSHNHAFHKWYRNVLG